MIEKTPFSSKKTILMLLLFLSGTPAHAEYNWEQVKYSDGIKIFNRQVEGSEIKEFKAEAIIDAPLEIIFEVMIDVDAGPQWMNRCIESRLVKNVDRFILSKHGFHSKNIVYNATGVPFPVSNRDLIVETNINFDFKTGSLDINFHSVNDSSVPVRKGYVRITDLTGSWSFKYIDAGHTKAIYQIKQNPGGSLPSSIINYSSKNLPYNTITALRKIVNDPKYIITAAKRKKDRAKSSR